MKDPVGSMSLSSPAEPPQILGRPWQQRHHCLFGKERGRRRPCHWLAVRVPTRPMFSCASGTFSSGLWLVIPKGLNPLREGATEAQTACEDALAGLS